VKTFVLDTNVLLHDPSRSISSEDNNLAIPSRSRRTRRIKGEQSTERAAIPPRHRILQELLPDSRSMHGRKALQRRTLSIIINPYLADSSRTSPAMDRLRAILPISRKRTTASSPPRCSCRSNTSRPRF